MTRFVPPRRRVLAAFALTATAFAAHARHGDAADALLAGAVFTSSNAAGGNDLLAYTRGTGGALQLRAQVATGGVGSGAGLGSQGAVTLSGDGRHVFVVNAGSSTVSMFLVRANDLLLVSQLPSGGLHPISVAEHDGIVYVLNDGGAGNVAGFREHGGTLAPIAGSARGLSAAGGTAPAQVGFSDDGEALVVSEKNTHRLLSYAVRGDGSLSAQPLVTASAGVTPFGFAFTRRNWLIVGEAAGGAAGASTVSSYRFRETAPAAPLVLSAAVPDTQTAACWVAVTPDGRWAYVANTGSESVSAYRILATGRIDLAEAVAGRTGAGSAPADDAVSADGRHLYVRNGRTATIAAFAIGRDGSLAAEPGVGGLPATAVGLAAN